MGKNNNSNNDKPLGGEGLDRVGGLRVSEEAKASQLYDLNNIKVLLDDAVEDVVTYDMRGRVNRSLQNALLVLNLIGSVAAIYSHFGVGVWPESRAIIITMVVIYTLVSVLAPWVAEKMGHGYFLSVKTQTDGELEYRWFSTLDKTGNYELEGRTYLKGAPGAVVKLSGMYSKWFHSNGYLSREAFRKDLLAAVHKAGKDQPKRKKN